MNESMRWTDTCFYRFVNNHSRMSVCLSNKRTSYILGRLKFRPSAFLRLGGV